MTVHEKSGGARMGLRAGGEVEVERALNAFRLTLFGILVGIGLTAGLGSAAFVEGARSRVVVGVGVFVLAVVLTALLLRFCRRPIAALMHWIVPGE